MPDWQGELEALLATLNVSLEENPAASSAAAWPLAPGTLDVTMGSVVETGAGSLWSDEPPMEGGATDGDPPTEPAEGEEVSAVRSEIEATVGEVVALVRAGRMDRALRDDVIYVLDALTRPRPGDSGRHRQGGPSDSSHEWNLASAAAVLRFCRIVLRLTNALTRDHDV
jgi:hypothetical protein